MNILTIVCYLVSFLVVIIGGFIVIKKIKQEGHVSNKKLVKKTKWSIILFTFAVVVFVADMIMFIPMCSKDIWGKDDSLWQYCFQALQILGAIIHNSIKLFVVDSDINTCIIVLDNVFGSWKNKFFLEFFTIHSIVLYVLSPLFAYGILLNMLYNFVSHLKIFFTRKKTKLYIFSELNDKMISLAESIRDKEKSCKNKRYKIIFCGVENKYDYSIKHLISRIEYDRFHVVKNNVDDINFSKKKNVKFFISGDNEYDKLELATSLLEKYSDKENFRVYLFSNTTQSYVLQHNLMKQPKSLGVDKVEQSKIKFAIVNEVVEVVNNELYSNGYKIFKKAQKDNTKEINVLIVGAGEYGTQMFKTLLWFCQVIGYTVNFTIIDKNSNVLSEYKVQFPEIDFVNGRDKFDIKKEPNYNVKIFEEVDVKTLEFYDIVSNAKPSYIFVSIGDDELNLNTAIKLREFSERNKNYPIIKLSMKSSRVADKVSNAKNFKDKEYNVEPIGDINSTYSYDCIIHSDIEEKAMVQHMIKTNDDSEFWKSTYNYQSSIAKTMHMKLLVDLGILKPGESTKGRLELNVLEHERWNAYTRSIGYKYSPIRNDLAKEHNYLVPFEELPEDIKEYDVYTVPEDI